MKSKIIQCKTCGAEIAKDAKVCPKCGAKNKKKRPILGIILLLFGLFCFIGAFSRSDSNEPAKASDTNQETVNQQEEKTEFVKGEIVELNGIKVTMKNAEISKGSSFFTPESGKVFVVCEFEIENGSSKDIAVSSMLSFEAYVDDYSTTVSYSAITASGKTQLDGAIAAGKKMNGIVGYEIPKDFSVLEISFTPDFWSGKDIKFIVNQ